MSDKNTCPHLNLAVEAHVTRLQENLDPESKIAGYAVDLTIKCTDCNEPFCWLGLPVGCSAVQPKVSFDRLELRAPITPSSQVLSR